MTTQRVSVVVTTYRRDDMLKQCLESLAAQTLPLHEVVVVDDGGNGSARAVVETFGERFRYLWQPNGGMQRARNVGAKAANGEWVAFLDDDDLWLPQRHTLLAQVIATGKVDLIASDFIKFGEGWVSPTGVFQEIGQQSPGFWDDITHEYGTKYSIVGSFPTIRLLPVTPFWPSALTIQRKLFDQIGGWNEELKGYKAEDIEFIFRAIKRAQFALIWEPTVKYRCHAGNDSISEIDVALGRVHIWKTLLSKYEFSDYEIEELKTHIDIYLHKIIWSAFNQNRFDIVITTANSINYKNLNRIEKIKIVISKILVVVKIN